MTDYTAGNYLDLDGNTFSVNERAAQILDSFDLSFEFQTVVNPAAPGNGGTIFRASATQAQIVPSELPTAFRIEVQDSQFSVTADPTSDPAALDIGDTLRQIAAGSILVLHFPDSDLYVRATSREVDVAGGVVFPVERLAARGNLPAGGNVVASVEILLNPTETLAEQVVDPVNMVTGDPGEFAQVSNIPAIVDRRLRFSKLDFRRFILHVLGPAEAQALGAHVRIADSTTPANPGEYSFDGNRIHVYPTAGARVAVSTYWRAQLVLTLSGYYQAVLGETTFENEVFSASFTHADGLAPPNVGAQAALVLGKPDAPAGGGTGTALTPEALYGLLRRAITAGENIRFTPDDANNRFGIEAVIPPTFYPVVTYDFTPQNTRRNVSPAMTGAGGGLGSITGAPRPLPRFWTTGAANLSTIRIEPNALRLNLDTSGDARLIDNPARFATFRIVSTTGGSVIRKSIADAVVGAGGIYVEFPLTDDEETALRVAFGSENPTTLIIETSDFSTWFTYSEQTDTGVSRETVLELIGAALEDPGDRIARAAAAQAQSDANNAALIGANANTRAQQALSEAGANRRTLQQPTQAEADGAKEETTRGWSAALIARVVRAVVPKWAQAADPPTGGGGADPFIPTKANLYEAVKAIFHPDTNAGVTMDDDNSELDVKAVSAGGITPEQALRLLPELPEKGSRDNKVPKFDGDNLGWEVDAEGTGGGGGTTDATARAAAATADAKAVAAQTTATRAEGKADANTTFLSTFAARVRAVVEAVVPAVFRAGDASRIAKAKLPADAVYDAGLATLRNTDIRFLPAVSPAHIDLANIPGAFGLRVDFRQGAFDTATTMRIQFANRTRNVAVNVQAATDELTAIFPIDATARAYLEALALGSQESFAVRLLDGNGVTLVSKDAELTVTRSEPGGLTSIARDFNSFIAEPDKDCRIFALPDYTETIPNRDALDGDYVLALREPGNLTPRGVDIASLRVYIRGADLATTEVHRENWTLLQSRRTVPFNISTAEESGAANRFQRIDNRTSYHFIVTFFDGSGTPLYTTTAADLWLDDETRSITAEIAAAVASVAPTMSGTGLTAAQEAKLAGITVNDETAARVAGDQTNANAAAAATTAADTAGTTAGNALARTAFFRPLSVWERTNEARTLRFDYRPLQAIHTNINATVRVGGSTIRNVNPSEGLAALDDIGIVLEVPITAQQAANISASSDARDGYVRCQIVVAGADTITGWMRAEAADAGGGGAATAATEAAAGIVRGATAAESTAAAGNAILGWSVTRLRALVNAVVPAVFRSGNTDRISKSKLPADTAYDADIATAVRVETQARTQADAALGSRIDAIPHPGLVVVPDYFVDGTNTAETYIAHLPYVPAGATGMSISFGARVKNIALVARQEVYDIPLTAADTAALSSGFSENDSIRVEVTFTGSEVEFVDLVRVLSAAPAGAGLSQSEVDARADARARLRYTDAEKRKVQGLTVDNESATRAAADTALGNRVTALENAPAPAPFNPNSIDGVSGGDVTQIDNARVAGFQGLSVWYGTKAQYDAISNKTASTIYFYPEA